MPYATSYKTKQFFFVLIKLSIVVCAFYFIYRKIYENTDLEWPIFIDILEKHNTFSIKNVSFLIGLTGFNWFFEILKWKHLVNVIKNISFLNALEQSLGGLTASLITPNRIGDYGAKAMYFDASLRPKIVLLNLLGNIAQMAITTIFGLCGVFIFIAQYQLTVNYNKTAVYGLILLALLLIITSIVKQNRFKIKGFSFQHIINFTTRIALKTHIIAVLFSLIRYVIFSFQFYYLLTVFGVNLDYTEAMVIITSLYFLASLVPSISLFDLVIKGSVAVFLFNYAGVNDFTVLSITTVMWLLNFAIPSVFGSYFVLSFKLPKNKK